MFIMTSTPLHIALYTSEQQNEAVRVANKREFLDTYLAEFMVRKSWKFDDPFDSLMELLAKVFPPAE
jgi:hypothetical protein